MALGRILAVVLLAVALLAVVEAGFVGSPSDVYVRNDGETTRTVTVEVTDPGLFGLGVLGGTAAETTATLAPGETARVGGVIELDLLVATLNAHDVRVSDADGVVSSIGYGGCRAVMVYVERMSTRYACFDRDPCQSDNPFVERGWC